MKTIYKVNESTVMDETGTPVTVYGIDALNTEATAQTPITSIADVFCVRAEAEAFAAVCTEHELAPEHLQDAIEDQLNDTNILSVV